MSKGRETAGTEVTTELTTPNAPQNSSKATFMAIDAVPVWNSAPSNSSNIMNNVPQLPVPSRADSKVPVLNVSCPSLKHLYRSSQMSQLFFPSYSDSLQLSTVEEESEASTAMLTPRFFCPLFLWSVWLSLSKAGWPFLVIIPVKCSGGCWPFKKGKLTFSRHHTCPFNYQCTHMYIVYIVIFIWPASIRHSPQTDFWPELPELLLHQISPSCWSDLLINSSVFLHEELNQKRMFSKLILTVTLCSFIVLLRCEGGETQQLPLWQRLLTQFQEFTETAHFWNHTWKKGV